MHPPDAPGVRRGRRATWTPGWPSSRLAGPTTPSRSAGRCRPTREAEWDRLTAACRRSPMSRSPRTSGRWPPPDGAGTRATAGGTARTCAGCWPASARPAPRASARTWAARPDVVRTARRDPSRRARSCSRDLDVVIAYRLLFGIYSGIVPDGIDDLVTGDIDWAGDATILLRYVKGRTAAESLTLPRRAVRLLEQWLAHSALLRSHAGPGDRRQLWLGLSAAREAPTCDEPGAIGRVAIQRWVVAPRRDQRRRRAAEDPPVPDPHHPPVHAGQEQLGRTRPGDHRPQPQPAGRRRPLPDRHDPVPAAGCRGHRRGRPARPAAQGTPAGGGDRARTPPDSAPRLPAADRRAASSTTR